jgi:hypothetical protein
LRWFFMGRKRKMSHGASEIWWVSGVLQGHDRFFRHKLLDGKRWVWGRVVMEQDPLVGKQFWPYAMNPMSMTFQNLEIKLLVGSTDRVGQNVGAKPLCSRRNNSTLLTRFWQPRFLGTGWTWRLP